MSKRLPKAIYVVRKEEGTQDEHLLCAEDYSELAEMGECLRVGQYQLVELHFLEAPATLSKASK